MVCFQYFNCVIYQKHFAGMYGALSIESYTMHMRQFEASKERK